MPRLDDLPAGTAVFIDANIFLNHFLQQAISCTTFCERLWSREIIGVTSVAVLAEVRHGLLRAEASAMFHLFSRQTLRYLREHPESMARLATTHTLMGQLRQWPLRIVNLTRSQLWQACRISERYGLLTNDALHLATLRAHRLRHLASADRDFVRVPRLNLWIP